MNKNIVLIHADQLRHDSLGCNGNPYAVTPNIDRLASESTVFDRHIASSPICMPSRASLLTGLYPPGHNVYTNGVALNRKDYVKVNDQFNTGNIIQEPVTMADMFANAGYDTVSFGKLHLTPNISPVEYAYHECWKLMEDRSYEDWHGPYYGFRYVDMTLGHGEQPCHGGHYGAWLKKNHPDFCQEVMKNAESGPRPIPGKGDLYPSPVPSTLHHSTWLANRFSSYLGNERPKDKPFFAFIGFPDPHHPFTPSYDIVEKLGDIEVKEPFDSLGEGFRNSEVLRKFMSGQYANLSVADLTEDQRKTIIRYTYAMVHQIDIAVGKILEAIEKAGLMDDTIIVFTSDHGDFLCDHQLLYKREIGSNVLLHVPFIIRASYAELPGRVVSPMSNCDVMPTLAALTGVAPPEGLHGVNIAEKLQKDQEHHAFAFCSSGTPGSVNYSIYDREHRLGWYPHDNLVELFDHGNDPGESVNLAGENSGLVECMKDEIRERMIRCYNPIIGRVGPW
ncbi:MAG: sulfatase-like hydrolase/transferase [Victivallales bacterium]|nr:sulfatase-like hydrolase/transferase [Victivallales bacterium]